MITRSPADRNSSTCRPNSIGCYAHTCPKPLWGKTQHSPLGRHMAISVMCTRASHAYLLVRARWWGPSRPVGGQRAGRWMVLWNARWCTERVQEFGEVGAEGSRVGTVELVGVAGERVADDGGI